ncbi:hypothetical protein TanjilG_14651 [Lupinus angustifolius]|uniref:Uncharacterized protein n=1 Tax=Lupinus angustifolius TaxID=3871 RepID=A0A1J7HAE8_LUPAN|nr:PREDICTED: protein WEAK CHLOROPLAST MOVEMENT UNDER BLUE LIGHT 1-like [Lupinus angustifolius]OIW03426.1 hypothetical protein TanjilG_14651 [Lupinus angustifolius]
MEDVEDKTCSKSSSINAGAELNSLAKTSRENVEVIVNPPENHSSIEALINTLSNSIVEPETHFPVTELSELTMSSNAYEGQALGQGAYLPINNLAATSNATTVHVIEQSHHGFVAEDSEPGALEDIFKWQQVDGSAVTSNIDVDNPMIDPPETMVTNVYMDNSASSSAPYATAYITEESNQGIIAANSEPGTLQAILKMKQVDDSNFSAGSDADYQMKLFASSHETEELKNEVDSPQTKVTDVAFGEVESPTFAKQMAARKALIDTAAPFESVKEAVSKFGGIVDWKAHRMETVEKSKIVEQELGKVQEEIPVYGKRSEASEQGKVQVLQELDSTQRLIEELKLNLERAKTEEHQARQDSELAKLRVEEMEQGIAEDSSIAVKAQLEVAKARYTEAITELTSVREELDTLRKKNASLVVEKDGAIGKAEEVSAASKQVEKTVEDLTIELVSTKESFETAHAAHMEAEEQRIGTVMARDQDSLNWQKELKHAEEEVKILNHKIESAKDLKSKLDKASALLVDLKAELSSYMESKSEGDEEGVSKREPEKKTHNEIQAAVASAKKELEEVKLNIEKAISEVNHLKVAATSLKEELEQEKYALASVRQREGMASITVTSLEAELDNTRSEIALVQTKEKQGQETLVQFPSKLQQAAEEANRANLLAQAVREELWKVKEEADQAKAGASTMHSRLHATEKEIESSRAFERSAIASIKALKESESARSNNEFGTSTAVTLSSEEYYQLSKQAHEAEEHANMKVAAANSEIDIAKESELKTLDKLNYVNREIAERRESLKIANDKAEKAREGKLAVEQELRKWRSEHEKRRKASELGQEIVNQNKNQKASLDDRSKESKNLDQSQNAAFPVQYLSSPKAYVHANNNSTVKKKKKKSLFPRILMFFAKRKAHSTR